MLVKILKVFKEENKEDEKMRCFNTSCKFNNQFSDSCEIDEQDITISEEGYCEQEEG